MSNGCQIACGQRVNARIMYEEEWRAHQKSTFKTGPKTRREKECVGPPISQWTWGADLCSVCGRHRSKFQIQEPNWLGYVPYVGTLDLCSVSRMRQISMSFVPNINQFLTWHLIIGTIFLTFKDSHVLEGRAGDITYKCSGRQWESQPGRYRALKYLHYLAYINGLMIFFVFIFTLRKILLSSVHLIIRKHLLSTSVPCAGGRAAKKA